MQGEFGFGARPARERLADGAFVLRGFALPFVEPLAEAVAAVAAAAPFRHMETPGGGRMSAAMTNCGAFGWISDRSGYRYSPHDPLNGAGWPPLPEVFTRLAGEAGEAAGFAGFAPDACLVNRYEPGARMALHQDRDERDFTQPIVSVSLGLPITFVFGGPSRRDPTQRVPLQHGDVVVWGGAARLFHHGVLTLRKGEHPRFGCCRINLTLRRAGAAAGPTDPGRD